MLRRRADTMQAIVLRVSGAGDAPRSAASASRAASAAGQSLSAKREQGVPGGAADYHKILNESPWVVPSFRNKAPSRASPAPSGTRYRSSLAQSKDHAQPASRAVRRQSWSGDSPLLGCLPLPRWRTPPLQEEDPSPAQPQSPPHACLLPTNPGGLHPPSSLLLLSSFFSPASPRATCARASDPPPIHSSVLSQATASSLRFDHLSPPSSPVLFFCFLLKPRPPPPVGSLRG